VSFLLAQVFPANYLNVLLILNIIVYIFFFQYFHWHRYIGTCTSHKESRMLALLISSRVSNASSSAEDERWLAYKSYSQMPSERNGNLGREDWKAPSLTYVGVHHPPLVQLVVSAVRYSSPSSHPESRDTPPRTLFVPLSLHTHTAATYYAVNR